MLRDPRVTRPHLIVHGFGQLTEPGDVAEIVAAAEPHSTEDCLIRSPS